MGPRAYAARPGDFCSRRESDCAVSTPDTPTRQLTHVSLVARDVEVSAAFYEEVVGCEPIPTPRFGTQEDFHTDDDDIEFQMLRAGDQQLHLWNDPGRPVESVQFAHFGIHVDDFERVYREAKARDAFAAIGESTAPPQVFEFNGNAQIYLRDPTGNLFEVDHPDIDALDRSTFDEVVSRQTSGPDVGVYTEAVEQNLG